MTTRNTSNFKNLLKQKDFTADELGRLIFYFNIFSGIKEIRKKIPFTSSELTEKMTELGNKNKINRDIFATYIDLAGTFSKLAKNVVYAGSISFLSEGVIKKSIITFAQHLMAKKHNEDLPLLVTEKEYNEALEASMKRNASEEEANPELGWRIEGLYKLGIEYYLKKLKEDPEAPNPLKDLEEKYKAEPVTDEAQLEYYKKHGKNPDLVTYKYRRRPVTDFTIKSGLAIRYSSLENPNEIEKNFQMARYERLLKEGIPYLVVKVQLERLLNDKVEIILEKTPSKWDLLEANPFTSEAFKCFDSYDGEDWVKEYKKDLNTLIYTYTDIVEHITKECGFSKKDLEEFKNVEVGLSGRNYWNMDKYDYRKSYVTGAQALFPNEDKASNGLAIVKEGMLDEEGKVIQCDYDYMKATSLYSPKTEQYTSLKDSVKHFVDITYFLSAWEYIVEQVQRIVKVDKLEKFLFSSIVKDNYETLSRLKVGDMLEMQESKLMLDNELEFTEKTLSDKEDEDLLELYKDIFSYIEKHRYKLDEEDKDYIRNMLRDLNSTADNLEKCVGHFAPEILGGSSGR